MPAKKSTVGKTGAKKTSGRKTAAAKKPASSRSKVGGKAEKSLAKGDHVSWTTSQGETHGVVQKKLTSVTKIKEHKVAASPDNPEYLVRSDKSGDLAAHKPGSLRKSAAKKTKAKRSSARAR